MNRAYLAATAVTLFAAGCGQRHDGDPGKVGAMSAPISPKVAVLRAEDIKKLEAEERKKIGKIEEELELERLKGQACQAALERLAAFRDERAVLTNRLQGLPAKHTALMAALARYEAQQDAWSAGFSQLVRDRQPEWGSIGEPKAYAAAEGQIAGLRAVPGDEEAASRIHREVTDRLHTLRGDVAAVLGSIDAVAQLSNRCVNLTDSVTSPTRPGGDLRRRLQELSGAYDQVLNALRGVGLRRSTMAAVVQAAWRRLLRVAQHNVTMARANNILSETYRALNDAPTYVEVARQVDAAWLRMRDLFYRSYSPHLAIRAARVVDVLLDDVERNLPALPITAVNRANLRDKIVGSRNSLGSFRRRLDQLSERSHAFFAGRRRLLADRELAENESAPSARCGQLLDRCGHATVEGELSFADLRKECLTGGAK